MRRNAQSAPLIRAARTQAQLRRCYPVFAQLRPHLTEAAYLAQARRQARQGYRTAFVEDAGRIVTVAGYRIWETFFSGPSMYVDDLVTDSDARSKNYGGLMLQWLKDLARRTGCRTIELDSGTQRVDAHRFYLRERFIISSFHFRHNLTPK